ncbi:stage V sporulation protein K [Aspergillus awamori]|uniref:Stage V sporulation protein K n=1 Tax=Aspergillus awamori TaxID=105351 RepID=A0A401KE06_ASPAW|nr:stage V sporulation protein K [Aspergillus awamori]
MGEQQGPSDEDIDVETTIEEPIPTSKEECDSQQNAGGNQPKTTGADSSSDEWQHLDNTVLDEAFSSLDCTEHKDLEGTVPDNPQEQSSEENTSTKDTASCGDFANEETDNTAKEGSQPDNDEAVETHVDEGGPTAPSLPSEKKDVNQSNSSANYEGLNEEVKEVNLSDSEEQRVNADGEDGETHKLEDNKVVDIQVDGQYYDQIPKIDEESGDKTDGDQVDYDKAEENRDNSSQGNSDDESNDNRNDGNYGEEDNNQRDEDDEDTKSVSSTDSDHFLKTWTYLPEDKDNADRSDMDLKFDDQAIEDLQANVYDMDDDSPSRLEWLRQKRLPARPQPSKNEKRLERLMDRVMCLIGQESVKAQFLAIKARIEAGKSRGEDFKKVHYGKTIVAKLYAEFLACFDLVVRNESPYLGWRLECSSLTRWCPEHGVMFIHRADQLTTNSRATDVFLTFMQNYIGDIAVILIGPHKGFCDTGASRLFTLKLALEDYSDEEIHRLLIRILKKTKLHVDGGWDGPYLKIVTRRICRMRSEKDFSNMLALRAALEQVMNRQALRLRQSIGDTAAKRGKAPNYNFLTKFDLLGPEPGNRWKDSKAWKQLQSMIGLQEVKEMVDELVHRANTNYHREIYDLPPVDMPLNKVFLGPPGTGKTTAAKLYGQIIAELGLLSGDEVVVKSPSDFIGQYIGDSEANTKEILRATEGKVLIIDDAHMLYQGTGHGANSSDSFRLAVVDTLVTNISNRPGDDRCIILIGYPDLMKEFFNNSNPGLRRRFPLEEAFHFQDYTIDQLAMILDLKMSRDGIEATDHAREVALEVLAQARDRPNFGNGGDVENLLGKAKAAFNKRLRGVTDRNGRKIEAVDFDPEYDRAFRNSKACESLLSSMIGMDSIISLFRNYQKVAAGMRLQGVDPRPYIPFAYVFKGPPGTGKTTTARILGDIFYETGFLSTSEVIDCSATDMIGEYVGQTGPKVVKLLERALGKVLFIDEAYRLAGESTGNCSSFASEAVGELVDCMTKPRYARKLVIVLAGYSDEMDRLLHINTGLRSRFPTDIVFPSMSPAHCVEYLEMQLGKLQIRVDRRLSSSEGKFATVLDLFAQLQRTRSWANARDVETLVRNITFEVYKSQPGPSDSDLSVSMDKIITCLKELLHQRASAY